MGIFSDVLNPHKRHGYVDGDIDGDFWFDLEQLYERLKEKSEVLDLVSVTNLFELTDFLVLVFKYRILRRTVYTPFRAGITVGARLEQAIERSRDDSGYRNLPYCEVRPQAAAILKVAMEQAAEELRQDYASMKNRKSTPRTDSA